MPCTEFVFLAVPSKHWYNNNTQFLLYTVRLLDNDALLLKMSLAEVKYSLFIALHTLFFSSAGGVWLNLVKWCLRSFRLSLSHTYFHFPSDKSGITRPRQPKNANLKKLKVIACNKKKKRENTEKL